MIWIMAPVAALLGYLLGAIPVGVLACRLYGVDIRQVGSGRTGATNAWRAAGLKAAIPTVIGDAVKGAVAIWLVTLLTRGLFPEPTTMSVSEAVSRANALHLAQSLAGGFAIVGHIWSVFLGFKGGAGGITGAATTMALYPPVGGMVWLIGGIMFWWSRIASIATFSVGVSTFAIFAMLAVDDWATFWPYVVYGVIAFGSVFLALRTNRTQLKEGRERVVTLW
ncbi:MAG: glycerol-3-phosphate acyltransferase [Chloroflexota bacterium]|nr:glycerol-3-phosphate acyltransferase [Chloroflexota bacterium]